MQEPYWVRDHREHREREAEVAAYLNPPPDKVEKTAGIVPLLRWDRTTKWWPKSDWERFDIIAGDLSPAERGYELREIRDMVFLGEGEDGFPVTSVEVWYSPEICEECPQDCGYVIIHNSNRQNEEVVCEGNFSTIEEAREEATKALAAILCRG